MVKKKKKFTDSVGDLTQHVGGVVCVRVEALSQQTIC